MSRGLRECLPERLVLGMPDIQWHIPLITMMFHLGLLPIEAAVAYDILNTGSIREQLDFVYSSVVILNDP